MGVNGLWGGLVPAHAPFPAFQDGAVSAPVQVELLLLAVVVCQDLSLAFHQGLIAVRTGFLAFHILQLCSHVPE